MSGPALVLEAAGAEDAFALAALERRCFSHPWSVRSFQGALASTDRARVLVLRAPHRPDDPARGLTAYCVLELVVDEMHIHGLAVCPERRRQGLGRLLLARVLDYGAGRGAQTAFLEVRQSNWAALGLYRGLGFDVVSVRRGYYERPREDALLLRKDGLP